MTPSAKTVLFCFFAPSEPFLSFKESEFFSVSVKVKKNEMPYLSPGCNVVHFQMGICGIFY